MKRIVSLLIAVIFLLNTSLAYTVTLIIGDINLSVTRDPGEIVELESKLDTIQGWQVKSGGVTLDGDNSFEMPENDVEIEAVMSSSEAPDPPDPVPPEPDIPEDPETEYMLTVKNFGTTTRGLKIVNSEVVVTATETSERTFSYWTAEGIELTQEETISKTIRFMMPANEVRLVANYSYAVTYDANGGSGEPEAQIKMHGEPLILSTVIPTNPGYTFTGWNTKLDGTGDSYSPGGTYEKNKNVTLYAGWVAEGVAEGVVLTSEDNLIYGLRNVTAEANYTMTYSVVDDVISVTANQDDGCGIINARVDLKAGQEYVFSCDISSTWGYDNEQEVYLLLNGDYTTHYRMESNRNYTFTPEVTGTYWIRLDVNTNGNTAYFSKLHISEKPTTKTVTYGEAYGELPVLERELHNFIGWYSATEANTYTLNAGSSNWYYETLLNNVRADQTYTITMDAATLNSGTATAFEIAILDFTTSTILATTGGINLGNNITCSITAPENLTEGNDIKLVIYAGMGVSTAGNNVTFSNVKVGTMGTTVSNQYTAETIVAIEENHTLFAKWDYIVRYDANGGTGAPVEQIKTHGEPLTLSSVVPTNPGYTFTGWNTRQNRAGEWYYPGGMYTYEEGVVLYAAWEPEVIPTYTVSFDTNGGQDGPAPQTKIHGELLTLSSIIPTKPNSSFMGWNTDPNGNGTTYYAGGVYNVDANVTLYAQWEPWNIISNPVSISFSANREDNDESISRSNSYTVDVNDYGTLTFTCTESHVYGRENTITVKGNDDTVILSRSNFGSNTYTIDVSAYSSVTFDLYGWGYSGDDPYKYVAFSCDVTEIILKTERPLSDTNVYGISIAENYNSSTGYFERTASHTVDVDGFSKVTFISDADAGNHEGGYGRGVSLTVTANDGTTLFSKTNNEINGTFTLDVSGYSSITFNFWGSANPSDNVYYYVGYHVEVLEIRREY